MMVFVIFGIENKNMDEMNAILKPIWGAEKWISEGWQKITSDEKKLIAKRMESLFKDGLPFELHHNKLIYIHVFSLLAQLEVLAIQIPLRFEQQMSKPEFKLKMRKQLLDEIFHGMVFTKIVYLLCAPNAYPPEYNQDIEELCNLIRCEECPKVGVVLLNLVAEGWIEELFRFFYQQNIAPHVFKVIIEDEHRHVSEADLYRDIGMPSRSILEEKLQTLENTMLNSLLKQPKYLMAATELIGSDAIYEFIDTLNKKHIAQLKKINMHPGENWRLFMDMRKISQNLNSQSNKIEIELTPIKQVYLTQWDEPGDPTMVGNFNIDVSCLQLSTKIYPSSTLTTLTLQAVSKMLCDNSELRTCLNYQKRMQLQSANVAIVVKLPDCNDHIGNVIFKDCHTMTTQEVSSKIIQAVKAMTFCYKRREQVELNNSKLKHNLQKFFDDYSNDVYPYPIAGSNFVSVSNIGFCGYTQAKSPLRKNEALKFTLLTVERKPVWNEDLQNFEPRDILPITASADHRVIDGNNPVPLKFRTAFELMFAKMLKEPLAEEKTKNENPLMANPILITRLEEILSENQELGYRLLSSLQTTWFDYINIDELVEFTENI